MVSKKQLSEVFAALGRKGGAARAKQLTSEQRREIAKKAAQTRWSKNKQKKST